MSEQEELQVKIRLVGTDDTAKMIEGLQKRLDEMNRSIQQFGETQKKTAHEAKNKGKSDSDSVFMGMLKYDVLKTALSKGFHAIKDFYSEAKAIGERSQDELNGIVGTFVMKGSEANMEVIRGASKVVKDDLEEIGVKAGISAEKVQSAFETIAQRSSHSVVEIEGIVESMSKVSHFTHGGMAALTNGFAQLESGVVRAQNPLVQMIATTGTLKGNAQAVAQQMHKMSPAQQYELAEKAIVRMNKKLAEQPLTMSQIRESMKGIREQFLEAVGEGLAGGGMTRKIHAWLMANREGINAVGKAGVSALVGGGTAEEFKYQATKHFDKDIADKLNALADAAKWTRDKLVALGEGASWVAGKFKVPFEAMGDLAGRVMYGKKPTKTADDEAYEGFMYNMNAAKGGGVLNTGVGGASLANAKQLLKTLKKDAEEAAGSADHFWGGGGITKSQLMGWKRPPKTAEEYNFQNAQNTMEKQMQDFNQVQGVVASRQVDEFVSMYNQAAEGNDLGRKLMMAEILGGSKEMQDALFKSGRDIAGGFEGLADFMTESSAKFYKANLKKFADVKGGAAPFIGHATFHLKQDFRQQDNDAIATIFREDVAKNALYRVQSSLSTPYGR